MDFSNKSLLFKINREWLQQEKGEKIIEHKRNE